MLTIKGLSRIQRGIFFVIQIAVLYHTIQRTDVRKDHGAMRRPAAGAMLPSVVIKIPSHHPLAYTPTVSNNSCN